MLQTVDCEEAYANTLAAGKVAVKDKARLEGRRRRRYRLRIGGSVGDRDRVLT